MNLWSTLFTLLTSPFGPFCALNWVPFWSPFQDFGVPPLVWERCFFMLTNVRWTVAWRTALSLLASRKLRQIYFSFTGLLKILLWKNLNNFPFRIHSAVSKLDFQEKERCIHLSRWDQRYIWEIVLYFLLCRWFRALQQDPKLRRGKKLVTFSKTRLY